MAQIISGKEIALQKKKMMTEIVVKLENKYGRLPHLAVILVEIGRAHV